MIDKIHHSRNDKIIREASLGFSQSSTSASDIAIAMLQYLTEEEKDKVIETCGIVPYSDKDLERIKKEAAEKDLDDARNAVPNFDRSNKIFRFHCHIAKICPMSTHDDSYKCGVFECEAPDILDAFNRFLDAHRGQLTDHYIVIDSFEELPK